MEEKYKQFEEFNWSDERWHAYLNELYPPPNYKQVLKFKKKWYKKTIDPEFDVSYEPFASSAGSASGTAGGSTFTPPTSSEGAAWASMGFKGMLCGIAYVISLSLSLSSILGVAPTRFAIMALIFSFVLEVVMKHPIKFSTDYLQTIMQEDVTMMPFLAVTVLLPGIQPAIYIVALVPFALTAIMSLAMICKHYPQMPGLLRFLTPLAEISARYTLMQARSDSEVMLGFVFIAGVFLKVNSFMHPLLYWNMMRMRYTMTPWTQASFRKVDGFLSPILDKIPGVSTLYSKLKDALHNFADVQKQGGSGCSIL
mmetsp:Transcript_114631/g.214636  ORF Transcript_114631/g.214636 Transcript_114631/m.214636 type:complete len:311 (+) Transcript_114631:32-964(+)